MQRRIICVLIGVCFLFCFQSVFADLERLHPCLRGILAQAEGGETTSLSALSPELQIFPAGEEPQRSVPPSGRAGVGGEDRVGVLVKVRRPIWGGRFLGLEIQVTTGTILGMRVTLGELLALAGSNEVVYIEPAWRTEPKLDASTAAIGVNAVRAQFPTLKGKGVIIGAVDTGIDYTHLDFRFDKDGDGFEESSRILAIWDQTSGYFGTYYDGTQIESDIANGLGANAGLVREKDTEGHGTHVMGVAGGDGSSSNAGFIGVAPEAGLIMVKTSFYTSDILAGASYIFEQADRLGLPAVVNLSLGGHAGPHDGTSLFEQGLDELAQGTGRVIVVSAGNEGDQAIHVSRTLYGNGFSFSVNPSSSSLELSLWYPGDSRFTLTVVPPAGEAIVVPTGTYVGAAGIAIDNAAAGPNPNNGDNEALIILKGFPLGVLWTFTVTDEAGGGRFDAWVTSDGAMILEGDSAYTIDEPGNAPHVITVGAFNTKGRWPSRAGEQDFLSQYPIGGRSDFSSRGPTRDGRQKPELVAPGAWVASALSSDYSVQNYLIHPDGVHTMLAGTSVSAPHVSGVVALMLSRDPQLTESEVKAKLTETATRDAFTGAVPNREWGWGRLDAEAVIAVVEPPPDGEKDEIPIVTLSENPVFDHARFVYKLPEGTGGATLYVLTVGGRPVFEMSVYLRSGEVEWDLSASGGEPLASGLYFYLLVSETGRSEVGRLVIAR
jgi:subtilisin family serine protease